MTVWALDLDGVLWTGRTAIPGSAEAVAHLRRRGHEVVFVTNNSFATIAEQETKLAEFGVDAIGAVVNSARAAASLIQADERVFVLGGPGITEAVADVGAEVVSDLGTEPESIEAVLVGLDWQLSYDRLRLASQAVLAGARFVGTNSDSSYPTESGLFPGAGALVAAVAAATGVEPVVAGKPEKPMAELVRSRYGGSGIMVGDRAETDGLFAQAMGYRFGLVLSGVTSETDLPTDPTADLVAVDLAQLVEQHG